MRSYTNEEIKSAAAQVIAGAPAKYKGLTEAYMDWFVAVLSANRVKDEYTVTCVNSSLDLTQKAISSTVAQ